MVSLFNKQGYSELASCSLPLKVLQLFKNKKCNTEIEFFSTDPNSQKKTSTKKTATTTCLVLFSKFSVLLW